jgi:glycosyltransferase involved in cell wall biosynthesis
MRGRLAFVTNAGNGLAVRRAEGLATHLVEQFEVSVVAAPSPSDLVNVASADALYVIDPGRRGFPAVLARWMRRRPVIVEVGDPQAALYRAQGRPGPAVAAGAAADWMIARWATAVVVRGRELATTLGLRVPWIEIPDGVDTALFRPDVAGRTREELEIPEHALVVGVVGSIEWAHRAGMAYGWDVVEAMAYVRELPVWALIVGSGSALGRLRGRAEELGVSSRVRFPGRVPHHDVPRFVAAMDVCVSTQSNDDVGRGRTTAKLPEYLACDRFVLATAVGGAAEVLPADMLLPYEGTRDEGHPRRLATRLAELVAYQPELRDGVGTRAIALERYSYPRLACRLASFLAYVMR